MRRDALALIVPIALGLSGCGDQASDLLPSKIGHAVASITNGIPDPGHHAVGTLNGGRGFCTATLIGPKLLLTAAHCVEPGSIHRFEVEGKIYESRDDSSAIVRHPNWKDDPKTLSLADIALVFLASGPPTIAPLPLNQSATAITSGLRLTLVGYGKAATDSPRLGIKRKAQNEIDDIEATRFRFSGTGGDEGGTCQGDSGGPAFATLGERELIVGVTSTASDECGVYTWDTRVDTYFAWVVATAKNALPPQPDPPATEDGGCVMLSAPQGPLFGSLGSVLLSLWILWITCRRSAGYAKRGHCPRRPRRHEHGPDPSPPATPPRIDAAS